MSPMVRLPLTLEHALLGFLRQQPMHGYEIYQQISDPAILGRVWHIKQSQLYALLTRLEEAGYLTATHELQETRPPRKVYHLTPAGENAFQDWLAAPVEHGRQFRLEFLVKLYFARQSDPALLEQLIARQQQTCRRWLAEQQALIASDRPAPAYDRLVVQFRIGQIQAMLDWLQLCKPG